MRVMAARGQAADSADSENCWLTAFKAANELPKLLEPENRIPLKQPVCHETYPVSVRGQCEPVGGIRDKTLGGAVRKPRLDVTVLRQP